MPRAGPSSQRQRGGTRRRTRVEEEDDEDERSAPGSGGEDVDMDEDEPKKKGALEPDDIERLAAKLIRLALSTEYNRGTLKRDDINKKVLGKDTRAFKTVFEQAQATLNKVFGMELVELMSRIERDQEQVQRDEDGENAVPSRRKKATTGSKTWILRSRLDPDLIIKANAQFADLLVEENKETTSYYSALDIEPPSDEVVDKTFGSPLSWNSADQLRSIGILYVILALILLNGKTLPDAQLQTYLKRLRLRNPGTVFLSSQSPRADAATIETTLNSFIKLNYLDRQKSIIATGPTQGPTQTQKGRGRKRTLGGKGKDGEDEDGENTWEWKWGERAQAEVSEQGIADFLVQFMMDRGAERELNEDDGSVDGEGEGRRRGCGDRRRQREEEERAKKEEKKRELTMKDIRLAAGSTLTEIEAIDN